MAIIQAGITLFQQNEELKARLMASDEKPDNPRLIALVPDPEKRTIFKSVMSLLSLDASKHKSTEDLRAWGGGRCPGSEQQARLGNSKKDRQRGRESALG